MGPEADEHLDRVSAAGRLDQLRQHRRQRRTALGDALLVRPPGRGVRERGGRLGEHVPAAEEKERTRARGVPQIVPGRVGAGGQRGALP
jgi:hypothetical protein